MGMLRWFLLTTIVFFVYSCKKEPMASTKIKLVPAGLMDSVRTVGGTLIPAVSLTLKVGQTDILKVIYVPLNNSEKISWSTSNSAIANIDQSGLVTCISKGTAMITATIKKGSITGHRCTAWCMVCDIGRSVKI
jgi:hypothetical protein